MMGLLFRAEITGSVHPKRHTCALSGPAPRLSREPQRRRCDSRPRGWQPAWGWKHMVLVPHEDSLDEPTHHWDELSAFHERALLDDDDPLRDRHRTTPDEGADADFVGESPAAIYLRDISRVKLLTAEQEIDF